jgi:sulfate/thiosulfate transport system permease protein
MSGGRDDRATSRSAQKPAFGGRSLVDESSTAFRSDLISCYFLFVPLITVFFSALQKGLGPYFATFSDPAACAAIQSTLVVAAIAVPANLIFGISAAWAIAKFDFPGKSLLITLIDLPFAVSPVVSGLIYVLVFGSQGRLGPVLHQYNIKIIFEVPGIVLATIFVTFPFVARELIPIMQAQGSDSYSSITRCSGI